MMDEGNFSRFTQSFRARYGRITLPCPIICTFSLSVS